MTSMRGVLSGIKVVEMAGLGPAPFCAMMLADHGADVVRVTRPSQHSPLPIASRFDLLNRGRQTVELDLKTEQDRNILRQLIVGADALIEGFRPGVMEKLGFGPTEVSVLNQRLIYGRMTGWGQDGPLATSAGHDLNYAGLSGAIAAIGDADRPPPPPLNLVADFGGGGMLLAFGLVAALLEAQRSGLGQVVDAAMVDGCSVLMTMMHSMRAGGAWRLERSANLLDGGAPFYACYAAADGKFLSVCPIEPQFFAILLDRLNLVDDPDFARQYDRSTWPRMRVRLTTILASRPRVHWEQVFAGSDACVSPVLDMVEAPMAAHNVQRGNFVTVDGIRQPAPAPRFSRTPAASPTSVSETCGDVADILARWQRQPSSSRAE